MKIFISYTRESLQHDARVAELAKRLITEFDYECDLDQFHRNQNWPAWMEERIEWADRVLVIATPTYYKRWSGKEPAGVGLGAKWESLLTRQHVYELEGNNEKFIPVVFDKAHIKSIPTPLRGYSRVVLEAGGSLEELRCQLLGIAPITKPARTPIIRPAKLDDSYFPSFPTAFDAKPASRAQMAGSYDRSIVGLSSAPEELISNLFPIDYPGTVYRAKPTRRTGRKSLWESANRYWNAAGEAGLPSQDYVFEGNVLYRFDDFVDEPWSSMIRSGRLRRLDSSRVDKLAQSELQADKNIFIKLLTRCLTELCRSHDMAFSRDLRCHLFVASNARSRVVSVRSLSKSGTRVLCKAVPDRRADQPEAILHWQHQAFRHRFVRFGTSWFISITPFWAFTADGQGKKSRLHTSWSSKLRKPERNRAVLGHVLMWNSILSRETDMLRRYENLRIGAPVRLSVSPSIVDDEWLKLARDDEKQILQQDVATAATDEAGSNIP